MKKKKLINYTQTEMKFMMPVRDKLVTLIKQKPLTLFERMKKIRNLLKS